jgi:chromosome segregation protein
MRLRKIRLAGFKSFVDPTTIALPGALVGVVGPNGCGKSNVIDAVRWVMGEVSAKHLRGDTMADVVFTGSNTRKPVSQASVELVFDNSEGRLGGRYASYAEISVKRQVTRDSQSVYFVNGTRCRRRDVVDIFLGTGLGPRSYAIIEQGMISRIIEAKPEELRDFLEEAAGISKYKERRRETENRIRHTVENLDRLSDLREELGKRLTHLKRQATMAEKYKVFKAQERELKAQLLGLRWRELEASGRAQAERVSRQETALEAAVAGQREVETELEKRRIEHTEAGDRFNEVYRRVLEAGAEVARAEETIQGMGSRREQLVQTLERERAALERARAHLEDGERQLRELAEGLRTEEPALERTQQRAGQARLAFRQSEEAMHAWQAEWEALTQRAAEPTQSARTEEARIQHLEANLAQMRARREQLQAERAGLDTGPLEARTHEIAESLSTALTALDQAESEAEAERGRIARLRERAEELGDALHDARERYQTARGRFASLQALQQEALGKSEQGIAGWLEAHDLTRCPRLAERLEVEPGWETAVERVLGAHLEAVCVEGVSALAADAAQLPEGTLGLFEERAGAAPPAPGSLGAKVLAPRGASVLLGVVRIAETLEEALSARAGLAGGESVVTRDGVWLGPDWLQVSRGTHDAGVIARETEIKSLATHLAAVERDARATSSELEDVRERLVAAEESHAEAQAQVATRHRELGTLRSEAGAVEARLEQLRARAGAIGAELGELGTREDAEERLFAQARERLARSSAEAEQLSCERDAWLARREQHRRRLEEAREGWQSIRDDAYEIGLRVESMRTRSTALDEARARSREQSDALDARCAEVQREFEGLVGPLAEAQHSLESRLATRASLESEMKSMRSGMEEAEERVRVLERERQAREARVAEEREQLDRLRMQSQETAVRRRTLEEQLEESGAALQPLLGSLPEEATEPAWVDKVADIERRITRLGPINLAAIDEHRQQSERKEYLDAQNADLEDALTTLRSAIQKIDRETRARFKDTYEKVNAGLGRLFPRLFGGGQASLELTGEDLLDTGLAVMARPPGKRNASIHLLSGGEKALTAVALVFSLFELNPAPFCLLDEVDAPLDDYNVGRFCELVREMAQEVQFLIVTHNKITMELAQQLVGVTMNEPGVSRLVAVDLDEAVVMAAE